MRLGGLGGRSAVILVRPENPENIGLTARAMKNTGFAELRLVGIRGLSAKARKTAVHAGEILDRAALYPRLEEATADLHFIAASTAKPRKIGTALDLEAASARIRNLPPETRIGLLFGNERTGLTKEDLRLANLIFTIPQASRQPSYNLSAAVLLTLHRLYLGDGLPAENSGSGGPAPGASPDVSETAERIDSPGVPGGSGLRSPGARPLPRGEQDQVIGRILEKLAARGFIHRTNREHVTALVFDLFGRLAMTDADRRLLLALFDKGVDR